MLLQICVIPWPLEHLNLECSNMEELGLALTQPCTANGIVVALEFMIPSLRNQNRKDYFFFFGVKQKKNGS